MDGSEQRWGRPIPAARAIELDERLACSDGSPGGQLGRFSGMRLTGADVFHLAARSLAGPGGDIACGRSRLLSWPDGDATAADLSSLDLTGADLSAACLIGAVLGGARLEHVLLRGARLDGANLAGARLAGADLRAARLRGAVFAQLYVPGERHARSSDAGGCASSPARLIAADLTGAVLVCAELEDAVLRWACLVGANLAGARLGGTDLVLTRLEWACLRGARLDGANLAGARLHGADLTDASLRGSNLFVARLERACLRGARLDGANLAGARLVESNLDEAHLVGARLADAQLGGASLCGAHLQGTDLRRADLARSCMCSARFDAATRLDGTRLTSVQLDQADVGHANLAAVEWRDLAILGDEEAARIGPARAAKYTAAARTYVVLASALAAQGLTVPAGRYRLRAELMQRRALFHRMIEHMTPRHWPVALAAYLRWQYSWALGFFAGYGVRPERPLVLALLVIIAGAMARLLATGAPPSGGAVAAALMTSLSAFFGFVVPTHAPAGGPAVSDLTVAEGAAGLIICLFLVLGFLRVASRR